MSSRRASNARSGDAAKGKAARSEAAGGSKEKAASRRGSRGQKPEAGGGKGKAGETKRQSAAGKTRTDDGKRQAGGVKRGEGQKAEAPKQKSRGKGAQARGSKRSRAPARRAGGRRGGQRVGEREFSAGGVVVRGGDVVVIVPTRRAADGTRVLSLPKGHVDPGETPIQAAEREVREEGGIVAEPVRELGESRYWYRRDGRTIGKSVHFYLFKYLRGDTKDHDEEVEEARWIGLSDAQKQLTYPAEREMVTRAMEYLEEGESKDR
jgi:8-oxo-dGTP pyrophosphatase MutT (NUDIX family)